MGKLYIRTTQNVHLYFTPASVGERMLAYLIDTCIKYAYAATIYLILNYSGLLHAIRKMDNWSITAIIIVFYLPMAFYTLVSESVMEGQTIGKKLVKIKVVKIDGFQASFSDYLSRWLFRLVDIDLGYIPGLISMLISKKTQRIGDFAVGTAVITLKSKYNISHTIFEQVGKDYVPTFSQTQILRFNDNDIRIIKENMIEATKKRDFDHIQTLTNRVKSVMQVENSFKDPALFIRKIIEDYNYYTGK